MEAMRAYKRLHKETPHRELYVLHTNRKEINISERRWAGGVEGMMPLHIDDGLLLTALRLTHRGKTIEFRRALVDTGSTGTIVSVDLAG